MSYQRLFPKHSYWVFSDKPGGSCESGDSEEEEKPSAEQESRSRDFLKAALGRLRYKQLVNTDDNEDRDDNPDNLNLTLDKMGGDSSRDPVASESHSSYAEDEDEHGVSEVTELRNDFGYQELEDEYGSRPVPVSAGASASRRRDVEGLQSMPSQNSRTASGGVAGMSVSVAGLVPAMGGGSANADRVVGHEYGVRPLLDDDELQQAYGTQLSSASKPIIDADVNASTTVSSSAATAMTSSQSSSLASPEEILGSGDVFAAAPFRKANKQRTPSNMAGSGTSSVPGDLFSMAPFKSRSASQSQSSSQTVSPTETLTYSHASQSSQALQSRQSPDLDIFGKAPFSGKRTPSSTATGPSSSTVSPLADDPLVMTPDEALPGAATFAQKVTAVSALSPDTSNSVHAYTAPSQPPAPRLAQQGDSARQPPPPPASTPEDPFGAVPFQPAVRRGKVVAGGGVQRIPGPITSTPMKAKHPAPLTQSLVEKSMHIAPHSDWQQIGGGDLFGMDPAFTAKRAQRPDHLLGTEEQVLVGEPSDSGQYQRLRTRSSKRASRDLPARDVSSAAFSNMSFNDEDEHELDSPNQEGDFLPPHSAGIGSSQSTQNLNVSAIRHPAYSKGNSPPMVTSASSESMKVSSGAYDCGTWPRKHKRFVPSATAEPFTVKKK